MNRLKRRPASYSPHGPRAGIRTAAISATGARGWFERFHEPRKHPQGHLEGDELPRNGPLEVGWSVSSPFRNPLGATSKARSSLASPSWRPLQDHEAPRKDLGEVGRNAFFHPKGPSRALPRRSRPSRSPSPRPKATLVPSKKTSPPPLRDVRSMQRGLGESLFDRRAISKRPRGGCFEAICGLKGGWEGRSWTIVSFRGALGRAIETAGRALKGLGTADEDGLEGVARPRAGRSGGSARRRGPRKGGGRRSSGLEAGCGG